MDSLEIVPPPRSALEMMKQIEEKSPAVRKAEITTAELKAIDPSMWEDFTCTTAELPVQLVDPWEINNVFGEGNRMGAKASQPTSGDNKSPSQQDTTQDEPQTATSSNKSLERRYDMKKFIADFKANTNGIRKQALVALGTVAAAVIAGIVITKLNDDNTPVLILSEVPAPDTASEAEAQTEL